MYKSLGTIPYPKMMQPLTLSPVTEESKPGSPDPISPLSFQPLSASPDPAVWGPTFWRTFHTMAKYYSKNPSPIFAEKMKLYISAIPWILPCDKCRMHAQIYIDLNLRDSTVANDENLTLFFFNFHNAVNKRLGKREYSIEEVKKMY